MKLGECQNFFHKHVRIVSYCVNCDEFCVVYYCDRECYCLSSTCFSVPGYLYNHAQGVCFLHYCIHVTVIHLHYCTFTSTLPSKFKLCVVANGVSTICFRDVFPMFLFCYCINVTIIH